MEDVCAGDDIQACFTMISKTLKSAEEMLKLANQTFAEKEEKEKKGEKDGERAEDGEGEKDEEKERTDTETVETVYRVTGRDCTVITERRSTTVKVLI